MVVNTQEITKYLRQFIHKDFIKSNHSYKNIIDISKKKDLSPTSITFLYKIYNELRECYETWNEIFHNKIHIHKLDVKEINEILSLKKCKNIYQSVPQDAHIFEKNATETIAYKYTFQIPITTSAEGANICIYFILPFELDEISLINTKKIEKYLQECISRVYVWLCTAYKHARTNCSNKLTAYIYLSDHYKLLPNTRGEKIDWVHANTAYTYACPVNAEIVVCRKEEWFKCFIHETFHCMGLDFSSFQNQHYLSKKYIIEIFPLHNTDVLLFEAYCEINAEIVNLLFYIYVNYRKEIEKESSNKSLVSQQGIFYRLFKEKWLYEKMFSLFQCVKVLRHNNMHYNDLHLSSLECQEKRRNYSEKTNVLSYYILKSIYMYFLDDFLLWMLNNNGVTQTFQYNNTEKNTFEFCQIIKQNYLDTGFLKHIEMMEKWWETSGKNDINNIETQTLRMSLHEI